MNEKIFLNWINKKNNKNLMQILKNENLSIENNIVYVKSFQWKKKENTCFKSNVSIINW